MSTPHQDYAAAARYVLHDRGSEHLVLLLHGLGGDRNQPLGLVSDQLAGTGISVLAPDARAHGQTDLIGEPDQYTSAALAADVLALVDAIGLGDKMLIPIGISMGAAVGLELVQSHPDRVAGAVLIRPSFVQQPWPAHLRVFAGIAALLRSDGADGLTQFTRSAEYLAVQNVSVSAASSLAEQFTKPAAVERVVRLETVPGNVAVNWPQPLQIDRPVTLVAARRDPGHPQAVAELWHRQLPGSQLLLVPSRDEHPAEYARQLERVVVDAVTTLTDHARRP